MRSQHDDSQLFYLCDHNLLSHYLEGDDKIIMYYFLDKLSIEINNYDYSQRRWTSSSIQ